MNDNSDKLCIDLCSGLGGFSAAFRDAGWEVITVDIEPKFKPTICADLRELQPYQLEQATKLGSTLEYKKVVALGSPPCEWGSVASIGSHWTGGKGAYIPKDQKTKDGKLLFEIALLTARMVSRPFWMVEQPRGMARKFREPDGTVCLCQYGDDRMKPTDLWTNIPFDFKMCHNGNKDHAEARRGAKTGTQGRPSYELRSLIPYGLSQAVLDAVNQP